MDPIYHEIYVDIGGSSKNKTKVFPIRLVKDDTGLNYFKIYVQKDKEVFDLTGVTRATMTFLREDGEEFVDDCTIDSVTSGVLTKQVKTDETAYPGYVTVSVELYEDTGRTTSSMAKFLAIDDLSSEVPVTSSDNYPILTSLIADTTAAIAGAEAATESANTAATNAASAASSANSATEGVNTAVTNAEEATSTMNSLISSVTNDESTRSTNESGRVLAEGARVTAETSRGTAETARGNIFTSNEAERQSTFQTNEETREANETSRISAEEARNTKETSRISDESTRISQENTRIASEDTRIASEDTRIDFENDRQSAELIRSTNDSVRELNESARISFENTRIDNEAARVIEFNDLVEFAMLTESSNGALSMTTENDGSGRLVKKVFTDSNSVIRKTVERLNFNADDYPQEIKDKTFDAVAKGDKYYDHVVTYAVDGGITQDTVTEIPYTSVDLSVTRAGKVFNPLEAVNPESLTVYDNNVLSGMAQAATVNIANNESSVEIVGEKILDTFKNSNGIQQTVDITKVPFVGGDTQSIEYSITDGYLLTNPNRTVKVKYYPGGINVDAAPAPEDVNWAELTQAEIDKLKTANEFPVTLPDYTGRTATVNGMPVVAQSASIPAVRDDMNGKIRNSTVENPNELRFCAMSTLQSPTNITGYWQSGFQIPDSTAEYGKVYTQNGICLTASHNVSGSIPQILLSFNLIREVEDKYGSIPGSTTAEKVAWLKSNISIVGCNAYIYGVSPLGNKVYLQRFVNGAWVGSANNTSSSAILTQSVEVVSINTMVQTDGFVHFLCYTDAARTTDSTLLVLTGHGLVLGDVVENITRGVQTYLVYIGTNHVTIGATVTGQQAGDSIIKYKYSVTSKISESGTTDLLIKLTNHGLSATDNSGVHYIKNSTRAMATRKVTVIDANTLQLTSAITGQVQGDDIRLCPWFGTQTAEATVIPSTVYLDYASIDISFKASSADYEILVPSNPRRDAGLGYAVAMEKGYANITDGAGTDGITNFRNKIAGSTVACPHVAKATFFSNAPTVLLSPATFTNNEIDYSKIDFQNGIVFNTGMSVLINGGIPQHLFSLNVIEEVKRKNSWTQLPITYTGNGATDLANEVAWCKANISKLTAKWWGFGSYPSGNKAYFTGYYIPSSTWGYWVPQSVITSTVSGCAFTSNNTNGLIGADGFIHLLAYTDASDGVTVSQINTDYVSLDIEFLAPTNAINFFTNNSTEVENVTAGKAPAIMLEMDATAVARDLCGGSNAALKALYKTTTNADLYAMAQGANAGVVVNGVKIKGYTTAWQDLGSNVTAAIAKINAVLNSSGYLQSTNKIYVLVHAQYGSDGTIPSSLSLDNFKVTVSLTRVPDVVATKQIYLPSQWSISTWVSPLWANDVAVDNKRVLVLYKDANNYLALRYDIATDKFALLRCIGGTITNLYGTAQTFSKNQTYGFSISQGTNIKLDWLKNNAVKETPAAYADGLKMPTGLYSLYVLQNNDGTYQADAFASRFIFSPTVPTDSETENRLRGLSAGFEFPTMTGTVKLLPNNKYTLVGTGTLYCNALQTRTVTAGDIVTSAVENKIILDGASSIKLKM